VTPALALLLAAAVLLLVRWQRRRAWRHGPHYVDHIQVLKTDRPLALPPVKPLQATPAKPAKRTRKPRTPRVVALTRTGTE